MHIFISYSKKNRDYAQRLKTKLLSEGFDVWIDDRIDYGEDWWRTIVQAIRKASAFVVIMTDESDSSAWVQREVTLAEKYQIPPFPLWLSGDFHASDNWAIYVRTQYIDVRDDLLPIDDFYQRLGQVAQRKSRIGVDVTPPTAEPPPVTIDPELAREIANPPAPDTVTLPILKIPEQVGAEFIPTAAPNITNRTSYRRCSTIIAIIVLVAIMLTIFILPFLNPPVSTATPTQSNVADMPTLDPAQAAASTHAAVITKTAAVWTPTPSSTLTPSHTDTATPDVQGTINAQVTALFAADQATAFVNGLIPIADNTDWKPKYQTFDGIDMGLVPVGCFIMGSTDGSDDEKPVNQQCFDKPFWIDRYEVTNKQYGSEGYFKGNNRPRDSVTWFDARDFCLKRGARLPTEKEWEYTVRGPSNWVYPWQGDLVADNVVYSGNSNNQTADVGSRPSGNSWAGVSDLSGNVWEWVSTMYGVDTNNNYNFSENGEKLFPYPYEATDGREQDSNDRTFARVLHGGSWINNGSDVRAANRNRNFPSNTTNSIGFRCARS